MQISKLNIGPLLTSKQGAAKPLVLNEGYLSTLSPDASPAETVLQSQADNIQTMSASIPEGHTPSTSNKRDADDQLIAAWFKLMKPHDDKDSSLFTSRQKHDDPGRLPDPLYEPTKAHVPDSLKIITFNDLMRAFAPKKPHWKHYDDASDQFQVGSKERD
jgi:hypothetical protein